MNSGRAGTGSSSVGRPDHVLLCTHGHSELADDNSTTAYTFTEATKSIKVTVSVADLPSLSYFHVSCPDLQDSPFAESPEILWSSEDLVLFRVDLAGSDPRRREFFIYRAGREPSLDLLPDVGAYFFREGLNPALAGVIPDGDGDGRGFVLAVFKRDWRSGQCKLHVFRSKRRAWTIEHLAPDLRSWITKRSPVSPKKVVAVGGAVGYVDHWKGILLCKVLEEPVTTHFIPLPNPLPGNRRHYGGGSSGRSIRDVACSDDGSTITCVEMEDLHRVIRSGAPGPDADVLQDSDVDPTKVVETVKLRWVGWRLVTWHREVSSDRWRKGCILHDGELGTLSLPPHPARTQPLPPEHLKPSGSASGPDKLPLNRMFTCCPILCRDGVVCLLSRRGNYSDKDAWIVTVDMRKKEVIGVAPFYDERVMLFNPAYISCALKKYLKSESDGGGSLAVEVEDTCTHGKASSAVPEKHK